MSPHKSAQRAPRLRQGILLLLSLTAASALAASHAPPVPMQLPPLQQPASGEHHPGKVIWMELVTPDLAGAQHFYGGLFGWTFQEVPGAPVPYSIALDNGTPVAALVQPRSPSHGRRQPQWLPFLSARDVTGIKNAAVAQGGRMLSPPRVYPQRGEQAVLSDPQGAMFGLLASSSGDPPDDLADPGGWIWASLLTREPHSVASFYQRLFGFDVDPLPAEDGGNHFLLSAEGFARASVNKLPAAAQKDSPYWLSFVRVQDTAAAAAQVKSLGGTVVTEPRPDRDGAMMAVAADPQGAPFGLMEWTEEASASPDTGEHPQ
jgi:uncharacterized protein